MKLKEKIEALEQQMAALQSQIAELKEIESKVEDKEMKPWTPEHDELFCYVSEIGIVYNAVRCESLWQDRVIGCLNAYRTKEEAEFWAERFKVFRELSLFALRQVPDSSEGEAVYMIEYDSCKDSCYITFRYTSVLSPVVFESAEIARQAIEYVGEERLKKYWFMTWC